MQMNELREMLVAVGGVAQLAAPAVLATGAVLAGRRRGAPESSWLTGRVAVVTALLLAALSLFGAVAESRDLSELAGPIVALLIGFLGVVIVRFAQRYIAGEEHQGRFVQRLLSTIAASSLVAVADHLALVVGAWLLTSLSVQQLLLHYPERVAAQAASHKKFLCSRAADLCLFGALGLLYQSHGTLSITVLRSIAESASMWGIADHAAAALIAAAVLLRTAQMPFHGWLMQVMEAPTPVSALLHAGVVNLGGLVLVRLGDVVIGSAVAQFMLVVAGVVTAVLAALVAATRVTVKVALAWSTCAQMGFMTLECGLGLHGAALLHLVAHSLYKAHAFLRAGSHVQRSLVKKMAEPERGVSVQGLLVGLAISALVVFGGFAALGLRWDRDPGLMAMACVVALGLARPVAAAAGTSLMLPAVTICAWAGLHAVFEGAGAPAGSHGLHEWVLAGGVALAFLALFVVRAVVEVRPEGPFARRLQAACFAGFYVDDWFSRFVLHVWPVRSQGRRDALIGDLQ
jgi:NAD(P)H-quinone oxidoreductase subunit 5